MTSDTFLGVKRSTVIDRRYRGCTGQLFAIVRTMGAPKNRGSPAGRWHRRRTRITRTIDGFALFASMSASVPVLMMPGIVGRGIIGAGAECGAEKKQGQFPFPEAA
jgi:hypothetical protein